MKTIDNYFWELERALHKLPEKERFEAVSFYREFAEEGNIISYEEMARRFGTPKNLASSVYADAAIKRASGKSSDGVIKALSIAFASLAALPFSLPVLAIVASLGFALIVAATAIIFSIGISVFAVGASAAALFIKSFTFLMPFAPVLFFKSFIGSLMLFLMAFIPCILVFLLSRFLFKKLAVTISNYTKRRTHIE